MRKKIVLSYVFIIVIMTLIFSWVINNSLVDTLTFQLEERFISEANLIGDLYLEKRQNSSVFDPEVFARNVQNETHIRITLIDEKGNVLADTSEDPTKMNNHLNRQEVSEALKTNDKGVSIRYSNTVKSDYLYVAIPVQYQGETVIVRVSKAMTQIDNINKRILNASLAITIGTALFALFASVFFSKKIMDPIDDLTTAALKIANGDFGKKIYTTSKDQIGALTDAFNQMSTQLNVSMTELKQRNIELEAILNSMINGIIAVDHNKNIILINKFCFEILDLPPDYVAQSESMYKIVRNDEIAEMIERSMSEGVSQIKELSYIHLEKILRIYVNPIFTGAGTIIGSIVVLQDVTQIRKLEQMRSDFVSNVSHELKTPLTSIKGFVDTLKNGAIHKPETAARFLDIIDIESDRLYRLINDILLLSEIESMDKEPESTLIEINSVIDEVVSILQQKAEQKQLSLNVFIDGEYQLTVNRDRIKQLLINLLDNAIKYTEAGSVSLSVTRAEDWLKIKVSDTGVGFSDVHKERLFERFYRVDKGRSRSHGGTGLGLSIVKHIVLLYKGKINVESVPGKGTTFEILLPNR